MFLRYVLAGAFILGLGAAQAPSAVAQAVGAIGGEGLTYQEARAKFPGLRQTTFEKADLNGDGLIEPNELPVLQGIYEQMDSQR